LKESVKSLAESKRAVKCSLAELKASFMGKKKPKEEQHDEIPYEDTYCE